MKKNFVKEYFQIAKSFAQVIEDVSLLTEDCAKLANESTFGDAAVMKLEALGMPMAEALAALTDAVNMEDLKSAESWLNATDEEIGLDEVDVKEEEELENLSIQVADELNEEEESFDFCGCSAVDTEHYANLSDFVNEYKDKTYRVVNSYFEADALNITLRLAYESYNRYIRISDHDFTDPRQWYQAADTNADGYHAANVGEALTAALTSGDLGYIGGGPCDGNE